ncbi:hypothetical protein ACA910_017872 [Epithemia clementina (nom. ined.)]
MVWLGSGKSFSEMKDAVEDYERECKIPRWDDGFDGQEWASMPLNKSTTENMDVLTADTEAQNRVSQNPIPNIRSTVNVQVNYASNNNDEDSESDEDWEE